MITNTTPDLRSSNARTLDETAAWLAGRVPDRVPPGTSLLLLATPSWTSAAAGELAARLTDEFGHHQGFNWDPGNGSPSSGLGPKLRQLARELLAFNPNERTIAALRDAIDAEVSRYRSPPPAHASHPPEFVELAEDLGVTLPPEHDNAATALTAAVFRACRDERYKELLGRFAFNAGNLEACFLRRALVEAGLPKLRRGSLFERTEAQLRPKQPAFVSRECAAPTGYDFEAWLRENGGVPVEHSVDRHRMSLDFEARVGASNAGHFHEANKDRRGEFEREFSEAHAALRDRFNAQLEGIVAELDKLCAALPIGGALWFARDLRRHIAANPADKPVTMRTVALGMFRAFDLKIDASRSSR